VVEIQTQARLVDRGSAGFAQRGLSTTVPRAEIEETIRRGEYPARLVLDMGRMEGDAVTAAGQVSVDWDEATLEALLRMTDEKDVVLWFDPAELEQALAGSEVDAHGLRETAAAVAVVVAAAGATAGGAFAMTGGPTTDIGGGGVATAPAAFVTDVSSGGTGQPATAAPDAAPSFVTDVSSGGTGQPATAAPEAPLSFVTDVSSGGTGQPEGDALSRYVTNVGGPEGDAVSRYVTNVGDEAPAATPGGDGISLSSPGVDAGIAAGLALLITGAGFAVARTRTRPAQPA
jgi:hypothetical protein